MQEALSNECGLMLPRARANINVAARLPVPAELVDLLQHPVAVPHEVHDPPMLGSFRGGVEAALPGVAISLGRAHVIGAAMLAAAQLVLHGRRAAEATAARTRAAPPAAEHAGDRRRI